jgi:hypothetical protein
MAAAFFFTVPGPKMLWQFQELGYDIDINFNGRTGNKPLVWGDESLSYYEDAERQKLCGATAAIINLTHDYEDVFENGTFNWESNGSVRSITISHNSMDIVIVGNFDLAKKFAAPGFTKIGTWYDFFSGATYEVTNTNQQIELQAGEFHIYTSNDIPSPTPGLVNGLKLEDISSTVRTFPNPASTDITLAMNNPLMGAIQVRLINLTGQTQKTITIHKHQFNDQISVDVSKVPSGFYLLEMVKDNKRAVNKVLIKN